MENKLTKKYGLFTAICMVVGIVIGSGVFFKAQDILNYTGGNMPLGIIAWIVGGAIMIICALAFSVLATRFEKVNGLVDYAEATVGERYAYNVGWFMSTIYYPAMTSVLCWVSARYTLVLFGSSDITGGTCMTLACLYLCLSYALNAFSPKLAGKFQVSTTVIKLVPLCLMMIVGIIVGIVNGNTPSAFDTWHIVTGGGKWSTLFAAVVATSFAYEGWIIATTINSEIKNSKRNLPIALFVGALIIVGVYVFYYIGLTGGADVPTLMKDGATTAFVNIFGKIGGNVLNAFIVISCLGTLNGLMVGCTRGIYSIAARDRGPAAKMFKQVDPVTNMPNNAAAFGLLMCGVWLFYFYGANLRESLFGLFSFDSSELPIVTIYALYIPIFIMFIAKHGKENKVKNVLLPILAIIASVAMVFMAVYAHGINKYISASKEGQFSFPVLFYLIIFAVVMVFGNIFYKKKDK